MVDGGRLRRWPNPQGRTRRRQAGTGRPARASVHRLSVTFETRGVPRGGRSPLARRRDEVAEYGERWTEIPTETGRLSSRPSKQNLSLSGVVVVAAPPQGPASRRLSERPASSSRVFQ